MMKFLKNLHYIDYLLFISALPVFFVLPFFMKIYVLLVLVALFLNKRAIKFFYGLGIVFILLSFVEFNRDDYFIFYMKILSSLLFMAVLLQKMKNEYNFYMLISPLLFLIFSVVFFQNIYMLFYVFIEIFVFIYAFLLKDLDKKEAFKWSVNIYIFSLPIVILLFLFFPRPHLKNIQFGLKAKAISGFSEVLDSNVSEVIKNDAIVAEVKFNEIPKSLYFRGSVLYKRVGSKWVKVLGRDELLSYKRVINYTLKQYPTLKKNIFALDLSIKNKNLILTPFYTLESKKNIENVFFARLKSVEDYKLIAKTLPKEAFEFNKNYNKYAQKLAKKFLKIKDKEKRLKAIENFFISQKFIYTLTPKNLDGLNIVDSLFKYKNGYCTHFASAFALFTRMCKIPSRIVVGYLGKKKNLVKNYLILKESDAHAWVEVYINRWIRIDPTNFAYKNEVGLIQKPNKFVLWVRYVKFLLEEWVLNYDFLKQQAFFRWLKSNFYIFVGMFLIFIALLGLFIRCDLECKLKRKLKKLGYNKQESIYKFLEKRDKRLNELYHKWKFYKISKEEFKELKKLISKL